MCVCVYIVQHYSSINDQWLVFNVSVSENLLRLYGQIISSIEIHNAMFLKVYITVVENQSYFKIYIGMKRRLHVILSFWRYICEFGRNYFKFIEMAILFHVIYNSMVFANVLLFVLFLTSLSLSLAAKCILSSWGRWCPFYQFAT